MQDPYRKETDIKDCNTKSPSIVKLFFAGVFRSIRSIFFFSLYLLIYPFLHLYSLMQYMGRKELNIEVQQGYEKLFMEFHKQIPGVGRLYPDEAAFHMPAMTIMNVVFYTFVICFALDCLGVPPP